MVDTIEFLTPEGEPNDNIIRYAYEQTKLKASSSADVLGIIHLPEYELLSQSKSVIAVHGMKNPKYHKMWFKMVAFDEDSLTARRKYIFFENERPKFLYADPQEGVQFECEMVLSRKILDEPYANENARRVAVLKNVLENFQSDIREVEADNKELKTTGMIVHQGLQSLLTKLSTEPGSAAWASRLDEPKGVEFSNMTYSKGLGWMIIECEDIVKVKILLGSFAQHYKDEPLEKSECN